ncbi:hypothetical protein [uncultured Tenacibaculum sp.]|uniref:hypothetical protein n=1 Tax=uncultured Tenacibaculum sp. TaxID=174713 RepID=UPI002622D942|nr:hypothetical protein [uncultured Tenacibaculum sp.]
MLKKNFKNWKTLSKKEQKTINGGLETFCLSPDHCYRLIEDKEDDGSGCITIFSCIQSVCVASVGSCN